MFGGLFYVRLIGQLRTHLKAQKNGGAKPAIFDIFDWL
jgi:hypothetical protein